MKKMFYLLLSLQLFANPNTNVTTQQSLSPEMKTFYDKTLLDNAKPALVHHQFGQKRPIPQGNGKNIEFRKFQTLPKALTPLTEGVTPDGKSLTVTAITATIAQYGDYVTVSDMLELTAIDNVIVEATELIGNQGGLTMDTVVRNEINSGTSVVYAPKLANGPGSAETAVTSRAGLDNTCALTGKLVAKVVAMMKADNVPKIDGDYVCILHPYAEYELTRDPEWLEAHKYTDAKSIYEGEIGKLHGVRFVESTEAKIFAGGTTQAPLGVLSCLFLGKDAYGVVDVEGNNMQVIVKQKGSGGTEDPLNQRSTIGWKAAEVAKILYPERIIRVECTSKEFSAGLAEN